MLLSYLDVAEFEEEFNDIKSDSDEESGDFGLRMAQKLHHIENLTENDFYVKILYKNDPIDTSDLRDIENILNRSFKPIQGRK